LFTSLQILEYVEAPFSISDSIFGSCFYMATGFHVFIGTLALFVSLLRITVNHFTSTHHFGFESAAWYWHFVDVVWLFLFVSVYWWGGTLEVGENIGEQTFVSSTLPLATSKFQVFTWCFQVINKLYVYFMQAELMLIIASVLGFFLLTVVRKKKDPLLGKLARLYVELPLINKFSLVFFTIFVAIPNKFWINNKINGFPAFLIATSVLMMGYIYPILFCCYFMYFSLMLESLAFGLCYEYISSFSSTINMLLFGNSNHKIAPEYFLFFWGNMFRAALKKFGPTGAATTAAFIAGVMQRNLEIRKREEWSCKKVDQSVQYGNITFKDVDELDAFRSKKAEEWTRENGLITKAEMIVKEFIS
jgi:heme/copper-type cytochrome/quinol oxidase subunit 3